MQAIDYDGFAAYLALHDRRSTTIRKHTNALRYLNKRGISLTKSDILAHITILKQEGKSNAYLNGFTDAGRLYGRFKELPDLLELKQLFKDNKTIKATLSDNEIEAFLGVPRRSHQPLKHYNRMNIFWTLIAFTGMRPGECAKLKQGDIDWGRGVISIEVTKTNTPGVVPIPANIKTQLKNYLISIDTDFLFPSARGGTHYSMGELPVIDNSDWHLDWKKRLQNIDLKRPHLTPYSFRHSFATRLLEENVSLFHVKKLLRHNDLKSTLVYEHLTTKDLIQAVEKLPLIRKGTDPKAILKALSELFKSFHIEDDSRFSYRLEENDNSVRFEVYIK